ncbi:MAG: GNAT family protein [Candidatus Thalassarchaeaceae archaeon]|nr:GNAT family protein [Candidatus Thalassarchaeaceae archaeon]
MSRRATSSIMVDEGLILRPASASFCSKLLEAFEETWPEVSRAMPWINPDQPFLQQIESFLLETEKMGRSGLMHHWVMIRPWDNTLLGLIGFDNITRTSEAKWNLGYWVRSSEQRHGFAKKSINATLKWLGEIEEVVVELKVDPMNLAGVKTVSHTVTNWNGERSISGDSAVTVAGVRTLHQCHLVVTGPKSTKIK